MSLFHHISFQQSDPLGGGLREDIEREQRESDAMTLDAPDGGDLVRAWDEILVDVEKDPDWFKFTDEDSTTS
jgi:hypothetical protein